MTWEIGKEYRTRGGEDARIYAVDGGDDYSIHGAVLTPWGWRTREWHSSGCVEEGDTNRDDLIPPAPAVSDAVWEAYWRAYHPKMIAPKMRDDHIVARSLAAAIARVERTVPEPDDEAIEAAHDAWIAAGKFSPDRLAVAVRAAVASMRERAK